MNHYYVRRRSRRSRPLYRFNDFGSDRWITLKILDEFPDVVILGVDVESPLGEEEVSSLETGVPVRKGHNFSSDRWISLKLVQEFPNAVFLGVDVESLLGEEEVSSLETSVPVRNGHNF